MADPNFIELTPELRERLEKFRDENDGAPIGGVGTKLLFEDDDVKIWEMVLEPGEASDLHHHAYDYFLVIHSGDLVAGLPPKSTGQDPFVARLAPGGNTVRVPKGGTEWAVNVGEQLYSETLIELKKS
jgi:hypothetical protein